MCVEKSKRQRTKQARKVGKEESENEIQKRNKNFRCNRRRTLLLADGKNMCYRKNLKKRLLLFVLLFKITQL